MASSKFVAVFLMCIVVLTMVHANEAHNFGEDYKACFGKCENSCKGEGNGYTFCEMKCDTDCGKEELKADLQDLINHKH